MYKRNFANGREEWIFAEGEIERILVFGDIHGEYDMFQSLYRQVNYKPGKDLLIFLGDYTDRGPKSMEMLDWLQEHCDGENDGQSFLSHLKQLLIKYCSREYVIFAAN